jgi:RsiW-degrading membrane proteinase PrsW (M82 family)
MTFVVAVVAGIIPMLIYPFLLYWMDRYEKEPLGLVLAVFLWGFLPAAILSLIAQLVLGVPFMFLDEGGRLADTVTVSIIAPITEEFFKGLAVLLVFLLWRYEFDGVFDGIIYGSLVGFGFAAIENVLYFMSGEALGVLILMRAFVFGLNHALFTSLIGIGFGVARHARSVLLRFTAPLLGLIAAIGAHSLHNTSLLLASEMEGLICLALVADWGGVLFVFVIMLLALRRERQWIITQLKDEVARQTLTNAQFETAYSIGRRLGVRLQALLTGGPALWLRMGRYFHILTKLAYQKQARLMRGEAGARLVRIEELRAQATALSAELKAQFG